MRTNQLFLSFVAFGLLVSFSACKKDIKRNTLENTEPKESWINLKSYPTFDFSQYETGTHSNIDFKISMEAGYEEGQADYYQHISMFPEEDSIAAIIHTTINPTIDVHLLLTVDLDTIGEVREDKSTQISTFSTIGTYPANPLWDFVKDCVEDTPWWITATTGPMIVALECVAEYYDILDKT